MSIYSKEKSKELLAIVKEKTGQTTAYPAITIPYEAITSVEFNPSKLTGPTIGFGQPPRLNDRRFKDPRISRSLIDSTSLVAHMGPSGGRGAAEPFRSATQVILLRIPDSWLTGQSISKSQRDFNGDGKSDIMWRVMAGTFRRDRLLAHERHGHLKLFQYRQLVRRPAAVIGFKRKAGQHLKSTGRLSFH